MLTFLAPLLAWGAILGAVPLIIHLLNRRRFRRVEWAPMRYLKLTIQRNRRRLEIEQLLLLLLRIALPVILFLFLARPILNPTGLERWLGSGGRSSQVVLIDDSLSMGEASGGSPAFKKAREVAAALLSAAPSQDRCTLATTSEPRSPILSEVEGSRHDDLAAAAQGVPLTSTHASWPSVLAGVDSLLKSCTYPTRQLTIITDLRKAGWDGDLGAIARNWAEDKVRVRVVDVGGEGTANVALRSLTPLDRTVLAGAESRWEAEIRNDSPRVLTGLKAIVRVDDKPAELPLPEIAPGQTARVPLSVRFPGSGPHGLSLELPADTLPGDDHRWAAVSVKDSLLIRLVDGEPSAEPFGSEVDYLAAPLSVGVGAAEAWRTEVVNDADFLSPRLETADVLVLANVAAPTPQQAEALGQQVRDGLGLMIFAGAKMDLGLYNDWLARPQNPILPGPLKALVDGPIQGLVLEPVRPSPLELLMDLKTSALERVTARQILTLDERAEGGQVRVLARWNDPARSPAIVERVAGEGRVLLWTTTADRAGSDWPIEPSFVLAVREAVRGVARPTRFDHTVNAGEHPRRVVQTPQQVSNVRLTIPGVDEPRALSATPMDAKPADDRGPALAIDLPDTRRAGIYRLNWDEGALGAQSDLFAANPDPRESPLARLAVAELKTKLKPLTVEVAAPKGDPSSLFAPTGRELWRDAAWALLALLIVESAFATWAGRSR